MRDPAFRRSERLTATLPYSVARLLEQRAQHEGRSMSNLVAYLLEQALEEPPSDP
jgi:hypothetical protein